MRCEVFGISFTSAVTMELESLPKDADGTADLKMCHSLVVAVKLRNMQMAF